MSKPQPSALLGLLLFFCSGLSGLIYEVLWSRRLGLTFGHSTLAVSTVVTAYMGGLALGSWLGGRWADRRQGDVEAYLKAYALLELFIGFWGALSLVFLGWVEKLYLNAASQGLAGTPLHLLAFLLCLLVLLPPTSAMGATLPILCCFYTRSEQVGARLSHLYAANTWGAVAGAFLAGFVWLPRLGLVLSILGAAAINGLIAAAGMLWSRGSLPLRKISPPASPAASSQPLVFALSGFASMLLQLGWTRGFSVLMGSSVYAFASILVAFLSGIALGSSLYARLLSRRSPSRTSLAWLYAGTAAGGLLSILILIRLPELFLTLYPKVRGSFDLLLLLTVGLSVLMLLLPTLLMGLLFPLVTHLHHQSRGGLAGSVGSIYAANSAGCILGSFLGGFWLLPQLGLQNTVLLGVALYACCALWMDRRVLPALIALALGAWFLPPWDTGVAAAGQAISVARERDVSAAYFAPPAFYRDGLSCTVALAVEGPGALSLRVNGKADASLQLSDRLTQSSLGWIPLLYHPHPRRAAVVGLGSGLTLTALSGSPDLAAIECAELEPAVLECQDYWAPFNRRVVEDPRVKMLLADGRTFLMSAQGGYDLIVSEPSNPWIAGIGNLYTVDFYRHCAAKLEPGGCFVQWCNLYAISPADVDLVLRTFYTAFPHGELWTTGGDLILVGTMQPPEASPAALAAGAPWVQRELRELGFEQASELAGQYLCTREQALAGIAPGPVNTDDLPLLEYSAPRSLYRSDALHINLQRCVQWRRETLPAGWPDTPDKRLDAWVGRLNFSFPQMLRFPLERIPVPWRDFFAKTGQETDPKRARQLPLRARQMLSRRALQLGRPAEVLELSDEPALRAEAFYQLGRWAEAADLFEDLSHSQPDSLVWSALATCHFFLRQPEQAETASLEALRLNPYDPRALYVQASLHGSLERAAELTRVCPSMLDGWMLLARLAADKGQLELARATVRKGLLLGAAHPGLQRLAQELGVSNP